MKMNTEVVLNHRGWSGYETLRQMSVYYKCIYHRPKIIKYLKHQNSKIILEPANSLHPKLG